MDANASDHDHCCPGVKLRMFGIRACPLGTLSSNGRPSGVDTEMCWTSGEEPRELELAL
jgi:hypothetical protein